MTETQLWLAIGIPTITVLLGIMLNFSGLNRLGIRIDARIDALEGRINARLLVIEGDLRRFYQILGEHSARLDNLEKR